MASFFTNIYIFPTRFTAPDNWQKPQNILVIAGKNPERLDRERLLTRATPVPRNLFEQHWLEQDNISSMTSMDKINI